MIETSIPALLRERASLQPNDTAYTFIEYEQDWAGVADGLTWAQLYRRTLNVAKELRLRGSTGDRAVILAPQGLGYILGVLGALQAGFVAVPLTVPQGGAHDQRVTSVLRDTSPSVVLTTSSVATGVKEYAQQCDSSSAVVEVDLLNLDAAPGSTPRLENHPGVVYLQYTSGSTRAPAGVMVTNRNLLTNFEQLMSDYFADHGHVAPADTTVVSWLPFYHDMGLMVGIFIPILGGLRAMLMSPPSFLQRPARWMQLLASNPHAFSAAPNFAFELATRKTSDDDMAGSDLGDVAVIINGSERVQPATVRRFNERFGRFNLPAAAMRPSYGMAETTVYIATRTPSQPPEVVSFESEKLASGIAERCASGGTPLISYGEPQSPTVRIVDPDTSFECPAGTVGEIWVHGENVAMGYWQKTVETERTFGGRIVARSAGTPEGPWLRTGDSGFFSDGELFIIGRIKDLLIVYGRNHSPDDIEATIQEVTHSRCAAIAVLDEGTEKLVVIIELRNNGDSPEDAMSKLDMVRREVTSAISTTHGLSVADLVLVPQGSIPITTSGKVRRAASSEKYRQAQFTRLDA